MKTVLWTGLLLGILFTVASADPAKPAKSAPPAAGTVKKDPPKPDPDKTKADQAADAAKAKADRAAAERAKDAAKKP